MTDAFYSPYTAFISAVVLGGVFGIIYDVFRIIRVSRLSYIAPTGKFYDKIKIPQRPQSSKTGFLKRWLHFSDTVASIIEDSVFWIIITICEILFIYHVNKGEIRIYFFICTGLGAVLYFFTIGKIVMYFAIRIIFLVRCLLYWTFYIIIYPIRKLLLILKKALVFINNKLILPIQNSISEKIELRYSEKRSAEILANAENGFLNFGSHKDVEHTKETKKQPAI